MSKSANIAFLRLKVKVYPQQNHNSYIVQINLLFRYRKAISINKSYLKRGSHPSCQTSMNYIIIMLLHTLSTLSMLGKIFSSLTY